jgi:hypothetical protein
MEKRRLWGDGAYQGQTEAQRSCYRFRMSEAWASCQYGIKKNAEVQQLTCPLLRDNAEAAEGELAATREQFVSNFMVRDLDFDLHPDLAGIREFGTKWALLRVVLRPEAAHFQQGFSG